MFEEEERSLLRYAASLVIPLVIFIYTWSFVRLLVKHNKWSGAIVAALLAVASLSMSGYVLWRMFY